MTTYACPRCKKPSIPQGCPYCGRDEEPLLTALAEIDAELEAAKRGKQGSNIDELKARHAQIIKDLQEVAKKYQDPAVTTHPGPDMVPPNPPKPEPIAKNPLAEPKKPTRQQLPAFNQAKQPTAPAPPPEADASSSPDEANSTMPLRKSTPQPTTPPPAAPLPVAPTRQAPPPPPVPPPPATPHPLGAPMPPARPDSSGRAVQTILLGLGGLLTAAALTGFTIYAWDLVGDSGRFAILGLITIALFAAPSIFSKFQLYATAETFAALASVGLWCTTVAAYYQMLPEGQALETDALTFITLGVIAVIGLYRALTKYTASSWALLGLSFFAMIFATTLDIGGTVALLCVSGLSGLGALLVRNLPSNFPVSDRIAYRALGVGAIGIGFITVAHAAYATNLAEYEILAALVLLAIAAALWGVAQRPPSTSLTTRLTVYSSFIGALLLAFTLAVNAEEVLLFVTLFSTIVAFTLWASTQKESPSAYHVGTLASTFAFVAALGVFGYIIVGDHPLLVFAVATGVSALISLLVPGDTQRSTRLGLGIAGLTVAGFATLASLGNALSYLNDSDQTFTGTLDVLLASIASAIALMLVKAQGRWRFDSVAAALLIVSVSIITHLQGPWWLYSMAMAFTASVWAVGAYRAHNSVVALRLPLAMGVAVLSFVPLSTEHASEALGTLPAGEAHLVVAIGLFVFYALVSYALALTSPQLAVRVTAWAVSPVLLAGALLTMGSLEWMEAEVVAYLITAVALAQLFLVSVAESHDPYASRWAFSTSHVIAGLAILWMYSAPQAGGTASIPTLLYSVGLAYLAWHFKTQSERIAYAFAATVLILIAYWTLLSDLDQRVLELYTVVPALAILGLGAAAKSVYPQANSWFAFGPGLLLGLAPSLVLVLDAGVDAYSEAPRRIILGAVALAVLLLGTALRYQAPLIMGAAVVAILTVRELILLTTMAPSWMALAIGGIILLAAGATFERQRRYLAKFGSYVKDLT